MFFVISQHPTEAESDICVLVIKLLKNPISNCNQPAADSGPFVSVCLSQFVKQQITFTSNFEQSESNDDSS